MLNWCMQHPWMTFFIILIGLNAIGTIFKYLFCGIFHIPIVVKKENEDNNIDD